jgi:heme exporter protein B
MAPGIAWVGALLATMLSVQHLYAADFADGSLDQMLLAPQSALVVALAKGAAHWLTHGLPLILTAPLVGLMFGLSWPALGALMVSLALGTPILSLLGGLGAALTLGLRGGGMLLILIVLPLTVPALIFGAGAVAAVEAGVAPGGHFSLLGALLIGTFLGAPWATAAALRISTE